MAWVIVGCSTDPSPTKAAADFHANVAPNARPPEYPAEDAHWGKFHSKRFQVTVPLPEGRAWKIDDHRQPDLVAVRRETTSRLHVIATQEPPALRGPRLRDRLGAGYVPDDRRGPATRRPRGLRLTRVGGERRRAS